jgi:Caspase domain
MPEKHALIIGINKYPYRGEDEQLAGCVNDALLMRDILISKFNFDPQNIVTLCDEQATVDGIVAEMDRLAEEIEQDDILVFHYSGHGSQCKIRTEYTDEGSGMNNYIIPTDDSEPVADGSVIWRDVRDHEFNEWLQRIAKKTSYTTLVFDACHSGTMTRGAVGSATSRRVAPDDRPLRDSRPVVQRGSSEVSRGVVGTGQSTGGWLTLSDNHVVISGCRDSQTSGEDYFIEDGEATKHGLLSYHLSRALLQATPGTTYRDIFERVSSGVVSQNPGQNPQIEGMLDREVFGVRDIETLSFIPVAEVDGDRLTLAGGAAHGLRRGSKWAVYPPGCKSEDPGAQLGLLEIDSVEAMFSNGAFASFAPGEEVPVGARCVEVNPASALVPLPVNLTGLSDDARSVIEPAIRDSRLMTLTDGPGADQISATIIESVESLPNEVVLGEGQTICGPSWALFESNGALAMPVHRFDEPGVSAVLLGNLEKIARFRNVLRLANPGSKLNVEFNLFKPDADGELVLANGGNCEFRDGDPLVLELCNHEEDTAVFFSILWISANREISHCYPHRRASEELGPGKTVRIGYAEQKLRVSWDKGYFASSGIECCKAIFSTCESDFSWLNQEGVRSAGESVSSISAFDAAYRGDEPATAEKSAAAGGDDWEAINRSFVITPPQG